MDETAGVDVYREVFFTWLSLGALVALGLLCLGVFRFRLLGQLICALGATLSLWFGLWYGVHMGYGAWQALPNPGADAYADGANLVGSLMFGWMPAGFVCLVLWGLLALVKRLVKGEPDSTPDEAPASA